MKKIYLFLLFLFSFQSISATHIIGGTITYEHLGGDDYKIRLEVLRDCFNGVPWFDNPASIAIYDVDSNLVEHLYLPLSAIDDTISLQVPNSVCNFPPEICVHKTIYEVDVALPSVPGGYTLAYQRCCRSSVVSNLVDPLDVGMTFHTRIDPSVPNSSPLFNQDVPFAVFVNTPFVYDASATDLDGDSLVYELTAPFLGATPAYPLPEPPAGPPYQQAAFLDPPYSVANMLGGNYPLTINTLSGEMGAIPSTLGVFQIAYVIKEFRNEMPIGTTYREFTFVVIEPSASQNYDVSGAVLVNGTIPLDAGQVQILERDILTDSLSLYEEQMISAGAEYAFFNIPPGVFYVKAIVDPSSMYYDDYLPTYYNSAAFWYDATPVNQCDTSQLYRDIHLIHVDSLGGMMLLEGVVSLPDGNNDPVAGLDLLLGNENGELVQARSTDSGGHFKFENLTAGNYYLYADLINSSIDNTNPPLVELTENTSVQIYLYHDSLSLDMNASLVPFSLDEEDVINIYPNPTDNNIFLEMHLSESRYYSAKVYNMYGQCINTIFENKILPLGKYASEINLEHVLPGIYFIEIKNKTRKVVKKIIKQ